ncbi:MAG: hypothetical protein E6I60_02405 [Chloroflexi bacterium]|nr:MAG: hypothetical protein E6I60_02405 [Chloroflexota bacterium]
MKFLAVFDYLSYEDIFVVGIGFDIAGAFLLAKGLLLPSRQIMNLSATYFGFNPSEVVARVEDKISTYIGVSALVTGFLFQLLGYVLDLAFRTVSPASPTRALLAAFGAAVAIGLVRLIYPLVLPTWRRRLLIDVAHYDQSGKQAHPYGAYLLAFGGKLHMQPALPNESQEAYSKRVWRVTTIIEGGPG